MEGTAAQAPRRFRQAFWDEPLLSEISRKGRAGFKVPQDVKIREWANAKGKPLIPQAMLRTAEPPLPELSELQVLRHFNRLSQMNFSVETGMYPLGSCTMKYNQRPLRRLFRLLR